MSNSAANVDFAEVIRAAAASPMGILALLCLILAFLAYNFFKTARERTRVIVFLIVLALVAFSAAVGFMAASVPPEEPIKVNPLEQMQSRLPVSQEINGTRDEIGGELSLDKITSTALGYKIDGFFKPDGFNDETLELKIRPNENRYLPAKEIRRIYFSWACQQKEIRESLGGKAEIDVEFYILGIGTRMYGKFDCNKEAALPSIG